MKAQYKEIKKQNPDAELSYEQYRDFVPSMRGFEYETIAEGQKKLESWRDLAIAGALIILTIAVPPVGIAASVAYGGLQLKSAIEGKDWGTGRELTAAERAENGVFGVIDAIPVIGVAGKAFRATESLVTLNKLSKIKDVHGVKFTANKVSDVVQLLQNNKNTWLRDLKLKGLKAADKINDWDHAIKGGAAKIIDGTTGGLHIAKDFVSVKSLVPADGAMQLRRGTDLESRVKASHAESKADIQSRISKLEQEGRLSKETAYEKAMVDAARNLPPYTRKPNKPRNFINKVRNEDGTTTYTFISKKNGKEYNVTYDKAGFPMFNSKFEKDLPEKLYLETDAVQFEYLSRLLYEEIQRNPDLAKKFTNEEIKSLAAGRVPKTLTWHHHQQPGKMQIVDYYEHQAAGHTGGRAIWGGGEAGRRGEIKKRIKETILWE